MRPTLLPSQSIIGDELIRQGIKDSEISKLIPKAKKKLVIPAFLSMMSPLQKEIFADPAKYKALLCGRRFGKCLAEGTLVGTPKGPIAIEDLQIGQEIYGWNGNKVEITKVKALYDQGVKKVVSLQNHHRTILKCTPEHRMLLTNDHHSEKVDQIQTLSKNKYIRREYFEAPLGNVNEPHAYCLGAFLGDGCSCEPSGKRYTISSSDSQIPERIASILGTTYKKLHPKNFSYQILSNKCNLYNAWCRNRHSYEKIADLEVIKTWNRESCLAFLAGLIDTDGSVCLYERSLTVSLGMQAQSVVESAQWIILALFQYKAEITTENHKDYKNGPIHSFSIHNNRVCKRIIQAITPYLAKEKKKWRKEYSSLLDNNSAENHYGVKIVDEGETLHCWDIHVDNSTNLYLLANEGLITHNTMLLALVLFHAAYSTDDSVALYISLTHGSAKRDLFEMLQKVAKEFNLTDKLKWNFTDQSVRLPNNSRILLGGCDNKSEADKYRGSGYSVVCIDEVGTFGEYLEYLIIDVIGPAAREYGSTIYISGTPKPLSRGYFYEATNNRTKIKWKTFKGDARDNPNYHDWKGKPNWKELAIQMLKEELEKTTDAHFRREYLAEWVSDVNSLIFQLADANIFQPEQFPQTPNDIYLFGIDVGVIDHTAIVVGKEDSQTGKLYIVETWQKSFKDSKEPVYDTICNKIRELADYYHPVVIATDPAAAGKTLISDLSNMFGLPIKSAEKIHKDNAVQLLADCILTRKIMFASDLTEFIDELTGLFWNEEHEIVGGNDHLCFIANTMIETLNGPVPIQDIKVGDLVLTRQGYFPVLASKQTKKNAEVITRHFSNGKSLTGTPDHKIKTTNGDKQLADLMPSDVLYGIGEYQCKQSNMQEKLGEEIQIVNVSAVADPVPQDYKTADVFNLTVSGPHEYFANGICVSNCHALLYLARESSLFIHKEDQVSHKPKRTDLPKNVRHINTVEQEIEMIREKKAEEDFLSGPSDNDSITFSNSDDLLNLDFSGDDNV